MLKIDSSKFSPYDITMSYCFSWQNEMIMKSFISLQKRKHEQFEILLNLFVYTKI